MKFFQIKSTEKGSQPARWYRTLVPSGITFSQLYVLLGYIHGELFSMGLSAYYTFETKDRDICIEEFEDGELDRTFRYFDVYKASGTYIDTFFKKGFKISLYTGGDFDLTIDVEEDPVEYNGLETPEVIKVSREIMRDEAWTPEDGELPYHSFRIIKDKDRYFRSLEELEDIMDDDSIMHVSDDPVTPAESIFKGKKSRDKEAVAECLKPIFEDQEMALLLKKYLDAKKAKDPFAGAIEDDLDDLALSRLGRHFRDIYMEALLGEDGKLIAESSRQVTKRRIEEIRMEEILKRFDLNSLREIAYDFDIDVPVRCSRKKLTGILIRKLFLPEAVLDRLTALEDKEIEVFRATMQRPAGRFPRNKDELNMAEDLISEVLAFQLSDDRLFIPAYIRNIYDEFWNDGRELWRQKRNWMYKCLEIASMFYGVMTWDVLAQLFGRRFKNVGRDEIKELFRTTPDFYQMFIEYDGRLVLTGYEEDGYYKILEDRVQADKPFYIPSRREIEEFWDEGCLLSSPSHQAMYRILKGELGCDDRTARLKVKEIYHMINMQRRMQDVVDMLQDDPSDGGAGAEFTEKSFEKFVRIYMEMCNHSHIMANRGYTPNDLFNAMGGARSLPKNMIIAPRSYEAAALLDEARDELTKRGISLDEEKIREELAGEKRKKIGRNEPCPCGSGKKYKNCCGKN